LTEGGKKKKVRDRASQNWGKHNPSPGPDTRRGLKKKVPGESKAGRRRKGLEKKGSYGLLRVDSFSVNNEINGFDRGEGDFNGAANLLGSGEEERMKARRGSTFQLSATRND